MKSEVARVVRRDSYIGLGRREDEGVLVGQVVGFRVMRRGRLSIASWMWVSSLILLQQINDFKCSLISIKKRLSPDMLRMNRLSCE